MAKAPNPFIPASLFHAIWHYEVRQLLLALNLASHLEGKK